MGSVAMGTGGITLSKGIRSLRRHTAYTVTSAARLTSGNPCFVQHSMAWCGWGAA